MRTNYLDYISVSGFKSLATIERLELRPINLIIGANGSGKSNFIQVFSFLHEIREGRLSEYVVKASGAEQILHFGSKTTAEIQFFLSFQDEINQYRLKLIPTANDSLAPFAEFVYFWHKASHSAPYSTGLNSAQNGREAGISEPGPAGISRYVRSLLGGWRLYHLHDTSASSPLRKTAQVSDNRFFRTDGSNLPAFLYLLLKKYPQSYSIITKTIRTVTPFFDDFYLEPEALNEETIRLAWRHQNSDQYFNAASLSDGTLRFIALAVLFLQPEELRPSIILIDEPELGLHPYAIEVLAAMIQSVSEQTQVILSTQSSLLLDHFEPEDVLVAERHNSATHITRLNKKALAAWLEDYSLGQLWEKNEIGGRPGST